MRYCAIQLIALISLTFLANGQPFSPNDRAAGVLANPAAAAAPPAGPWAPTNYLAWYDATMWGITNGGIANGVLVTNWSDFSPGGYHLHVFGATTTPSLIPYYTNGVVNTNCAVVWTNDGAGAGPYGLTNAWGSLLNKPWTIIMVREEELVNGGGSYHYTMDGIDNSKQQMIRNVDSTKYMGIRGGASVTSPTYPITNEWHVLTVHYEAVSPVSYVRTNGALFFSGDAQSAGWNGATIGSSFSGTIPAKQRIAEIIMYNAALATNDLGWVEKKLAEKYGLTYYGQ